MEHGIGERKCVFEVFNRRLPGGRRYAVVAGTARVLDELERFRFDKAEITWLRDKGVVRKPETLEFLGDYRFSGSIMGYAEGECFFPGSPVMTVEGTFAEAVVLETLVLSILNYDCAVAAAASRMTIAAHGRPCLEMGARRARGRRRRLRRHQRSGGRADLRDHPDRDRGPLVHTASRRRGVRLQRPGRGTRTQHHAVGRYVRRRARCRARRGGGTARRRRARRGSARLG